MGKVVVGDIELGEGAPLFLIAGPCVIEDETRCLDVAVSVKEIANRLNVPLIFKASYEKDNRSTARSWPG